MSGLSQSVIANEDHLVAIYRRTGDTSFTHAQIADLIPCGTMLRYTVPGIFIPARDSKGVPLKGGSRARSNVWRWHPRAAELCRGCPDPIYDDRRGEWDWYCRQHSPTGIRCSNVAVLKDRCQRVERYYYRRGTSAA